MIPLHPTGHCRLGKSVLTWQVLMRLAADLASCGAEGRNVKMASCASGFDALDSAVKNTNIDELRRLMVPALKANVELNKVGTLV